MSDNAKDGKKVSEEAKAKSDDKRAEAKMDKKDKKDKKEKKSK
jgi:hypothetical protein